MRRGNQPKIPDRRTDDRFLNEIDEDNKKNYEVGDSRLGNGDYVPDKYEDNDEGDWERIKDAGSLGGEPLAEQEINIINARRTLEVVFGPSGDAALEALNDKNLTYNEKEERVKKEIQEGANQNSLGVEQHRVFREIQYLYGKAKVLRIFDRLQSENATRSLTPRDMSTLNTAKEKDLTFTDANIIRVLKADNNEISASARDWERATSPESNPNIDAWGSEGSFVQKEIANSDYAKELYAKYGLKSGAKSPVKRKKPNKKNSSDDDKSDNDSDD